MLPRLNSLLSQDAVCMGQTQWAPARPHFGPISHHLQRKSLQYVHQERDVPCKRNLGPNLIWYASPATQWPSYDPLDVRFITAGKISWRGCSLTIRQRYSAPADWDGTAMQNVAMVGWRKSRNAIPREVVAIRKIYIEVVGIDCPALGLTEPHPSDRKALSGRPKMLSNWIHPYARD